MKLSLFLLIVSTLQVFATSSYSQKQKISLELKGESLEYVLAKIEDQTEFFFLYNEKLVDTNRKIDISIKEKPIQYALTMIFRGTDTEFQIIDRKIILSPKGLNSVILSKEKTITGQVVDANEGLPLPGVNVIIKGTSKGTITDLNGNYAINIQDENTVLEFSFIGYITQEVEISNQFIIDIKLVENTELLDEVVINALGFEEKKDELGYASSTVNSSTVTGASESTIINALSGKASGVRISRNSADPGAGAYIQIRGISSIDRDAQPLIVVDGVPISNDSRGAQESLAAQSRLNDINPNDIESVTVLKGASAAALWGTRALGGVIIIKTKTGQYNKKMSITYNTSFSIDQISHKYPMQTMFGQGDNGVYDQRSRDSWGDKILDRSGEADELDVTGEFYIDQDGSIYYPVISKNSRTTYDDSNFDKIFQNGHFWENNLSVSAGNENSTIFASLSDMNQQGIIRANSDYRRTTARVNIGHRLSDKIKLNASTAYTKSKSNRIRRGASSSGLYLGLLRNPADFDISGYRGDYYANSNASPISNRHRSYREPLGADGTATYNNPLWTINEQENPVDVDRFITSLELKITPFDWLELIGRVGIDKYTEVQEAFYTPGSASGDLTTGYYSKNLARSSIFNMDYMATAAKTFNKDFSGSLLVGFNFNHRQLITDGSEITNFIQFADVASGIRDMDNAISENRMVTSTFGQERTVGTYTSATFSAYKMLFLKATLRAESASTFGEGDNTFLFPSVSLAWQFTELLKLKDDILSFGKLRLSYGEVGVQPARYKTTNVFISPVFSDQLGGDLAGTLYGNGALVGSTQRGSSQLLPERKKEAEIGLDLRFLKDRLSLSGTYYANRTEDMLLDFPIANSRGVTRLYTNGAELENTGWEVDLGYSIVRKTDWKWDVNLVFSQVENKVTKLDDELTVDLGGLAAVSSRAIEGYPIGVLVGGKTLRDAEGNIVFDENGFPEQAQEPGIIGDPNPDWQGSVTTTLSYKNFSLSVLFETYQGADIFAGTKAVMVDLGTWESTGEEAIAPQNLLEYNGNIIMEGTMFRGKVHNFGAGPVALTESWYNGDGGYFGGGNDELYIEDGSWSRLREITLSYRYSSEWLKEKIGISDIKVSVTGRNLLLWTKFEGNDPDTNLSGISKARGIDYFNNPGTKSFIFNLLLRF